MEIPRKVKEAAAMLVVFLVLALPIFHLVTEIAAYLRLAFHE